MTDQYLEVYIPLENQDTTIAEILIAQLSALAYDGFLEEESSLKAYIPAELYNQDLLDDLLKMHELDATVSSIEKQNWNMVWESNFSPMQVDSFVGVRAGFHPPMEGVSHELIITPKMSFGTGHHGTTYAVMKLMEGIDFNQKQVFDFGTGTGILAILAEKLGAAYVFAVDNDSWCIENATENITINGCDKIQVSLADTITVNRKFDIVIANINRNILEANMLFFPQIIMPNGKLILSGLLVTDELDMIDLCKKNGLQHEQTLAKDGWVAIQFSTY
jgi:ribosomal protein L11 methyltransferase